MAPSRRLFDSSQSVGLGNKLLVRLLGVVVTDLLQQASVNRIQFGHSNGAAVKGSGTAMIAPSDESMTYQPLRTAEINHRPQLHPMSNSGLPAPGCTGILV
jgi:hypothetical protein